MWTRNDGASGVYHQVKRMLAAVTIVESLHRQQIGELDLTYTRFRREQDLINDGDRVALADTSWIL